MTPQGPGTPQEAARRESPEPEPKKNTETPEQPPLGNRILQRIFSINSGIILGAIAAALIIGALIVVLFDQDVQRTAGYLFARPSDFFAEAGATFQSFFSSLFRGSIYNYEANTFAAGIKPLFETLTRSVPLSSLVWQSRFRSARACSTLVFRDS